MEKPPKKLLEQVRDIIRVKHYSYKTEKSYISWIKRYILFHDKRHPREMGGKEIEEFLTYLAVEENVAASTKNQALSAILFLYKEVLRQDLDLQVDAVRAKRSRYVPTVLTREEVLSIINHLSGVHQLIVKLLYGTGLRQTECLQLRVKDIDFAQQQVIVRDGKGMESRVTMLPTSLAEELSFHLEIVKRLHHQDLDKGYGSVYLPFALERKYKSADKDWIWQFVFPSDRISKDPRSGIICLYGLTANGLSILKLWIWEFLKIIRSQYLKTTLTDH
jgi:integron integrase